MIGPFMTMTYNSIKDGHRMAHTLCPYGMDLHMVYESDQKLICNTGHCGNVFVSWANTDPLTSNGGIVGL